MKTKIKNIFSLSIGVFLLSSIVALAANVNFSIETQNPSPGVLIIDGRIENFTEGTYGSTITKEFNESIITTSIEITIIPKPKILCTSESWESYECSKCNSNNQKECLIRKKTGFEECIGETTKPKTTQPCTTEDYELCDINSWELHDCTKCDVNGTKECRIRKNNNQALCTGEKGKPDTSQKCTSSEYPICTANDWEISECSDCNEAGLKICKTSKKQGHEFCQEGNNKPSEIQFCEIPEEYINTTCTLNAPVGIPFKDTFGHWAENYINQLRLWRVVQGKKPGIYEPETNLTRAEFTKIALNTFCISIADVQDENIFPDVNSEEWYTKYIIKAKSEGIIMGYNDGLFRPNQQISGAEAIKIILETSQLNIPNKNGEWYTKYIDYGKSQHIINQENNTAKTPNGPIPRGEMAKIAVKTRNLKSNIAINN